MANALIVRVLQEGLQRGEDIGAVADLDYLQRIQGVDDRTWPDRNSGRAQRAGKADDVVGDLTGFRREMIDGHQKILTP